MSRLITGKMDRKIHALPETGGVHTLCGRVVKGLAISDALPDCANCLKAINRRLGAACG